MVAGRPANVVSRLPRSGCTDARLGRGRRRWCVHRRRGSHWGFDGSDTRPPFPPTLNRSGITFRVWSFSRFRDPRRRSNFNHTHHQRKRLVLPQTSGTVAPAPVAAAGGRGGVENPRRLSRDDSAVCVRRLAAPRRTPPPPHAKSAAGRFLGYVWSFLRRPVRQGVPRQKTLMDFAAARTAGTPVV